MNLSFPAVIKDIRIVPDGILATLDISLEDLSPLTTLIDKMVTVSIEPAPATVPPEAPLPFEPENYAAPSEPPAPKKRAAPGRKRAE